MIRFSFGAVSTDSSLSLIVDEVVVELGVVVASLLATLPSKPPPPVATLTPPKLPQEPSSTPLPSLARSAAAASLVDFLMDSDVLMKSLVSESILLSRRFEACAASRSDFIKRWFRSFSTSLVNCFRKS